MASLERRLEPNLASLSSLLLSMDNLYSNKQSLMTVVNRELGSIIAAKVQTLMDQRLGDVCLGLKITKQPVLTVFSRKFRGKKGYVTNLYMYDKKINLDEFVPIESLDDLLLISVVQGTNTIGNARIAINDLRNKDVIEVVSETKNEENVVGHVKIEAIISAEAKPALTVVAHFISALIRAKLKAIDDKEEEKEDKNDRENDINEDNDDNLTTQLKLLLTLQSPISPDETVLVRCEGRELNLSSSQTRLVIGIPSLTSNIELWKPSKLSTTLTRPSSLAPLYCTQLLSASASDLVSAVERSRRSSIAKKGDVMLVIASDVDWRRGMEIEIENTKIQIDFYTEIDSKEDLEINICQLYHKHLSKIGQNERYNWSGSLPNILYALESLSLLQIRPESRLKALMKTLMEIQMSIGFNEQVVFDHLCQIMTKGATVLDDPLFTEMGDHCLKALIHYHNTLWTNNTNYRRRLVTAQTHYAILSLNLMHQGTQKQQKEFQSTKQKTLNECLKQYLRMNKANENLIWLDDFLEYIQHVLQHMLNKFGLQMIWYTLLMKAIIQECLVVIETCVEKDAEHVFSLYLRLKAILNLSNNNNVYNTMKEDMCETFSRFLPLWSRLAISKAEEQLIRVVDIELNNRDDDCHISLDEFGNNNLEMDKASLGSFEYLEMGVSVRGILDSCLITWKQLEWSDVVASVRFGTSLFQGLHNAFKAYVNNFVDTFNNSNNCSEEGMSARDLVVLMQSVVLSMSYLEHTLRLVVGLAENNNDADLKKEVNVFSNLFAEAVTEAHDEAENVVCVFVESRRLAIARRAKKGQIVHCESTETEDVLAYVHDLLSYLQRKLCTNALAPYVALLTQNLYSVVEEEVANVYFESEERRLCIGAALPVIEEFRVALNAKSTHLQKVHEHFETISADSGKLAVNHLKRFLLHQDELKEDENEDKKCELNKSSLLMNIIRKEKCIEVSIQGRLGRLTSLNVSLMPIEVEPFVLVRSVCELPATIAFETESISSSQLLVVSLVRNLALVDVCRGALAFLVPEHTLSSVLYFRQLHSFQNATSPELRTLRSRVNSDNAAKTLISHVATLTNGVHVAKHEKHVQKRQKSTNNEAVVYSHLELRYESYWQQSLVLCTLGKMEVRMAFREFDNVLMLQLIKVTNAFDDFIDSAPNFSLNLTILTTVKHVERQLTKIVSESDHFEGNNHANLELNLKDNFGPDFEYATTILIITLCSHRLARRNVLTQRFMGKQYNEHCLGEIVLMLSDVHPIDHVTQFSHVGVMKLVFARTKPIVLESALRLRQSIGKRNEYVRFLVDDAEQRVENRARRHHLYNSEEWAQHGLNEESTYSLISRHLAILKESIENSKESQGCLRFKAWLESNACVVQLKSVTDIRFSGDRCNFGLTISLMPQKDCRREQRLHSLVYPDRTSLLFDLVHDDLDEHRVGCQPDYSQRFMAKLGLKQDNETRQRGHFDLDISNLALDIADSYLCIELYNCFTTSKLFLGIIVVDLDSLGTREKLFEANFKSILSTGFDDESLKILEERRSKDTNAAYYLDRFNALRAGKSLPKLFMPNDWAKLP